MASDDRTTTTTETRVSSHRRYYKLAEHPRPWWPWGLLPLLGLLLLFLYGALRTAPDMQANVEVEVAATMRAANIEVEEVVADGQGVFVRAVAPAADEPLIRALAAGAQCDTWNGRATCPNVVDIALAKPAAPVVDMPVIAPRHHDFEFDYNGSTLTLRGEVPTQEDRGRIVRAATRDGVQVLSELKVSGEPGKPGDALAAARALGVLATFDRGRATWTGGVLRARGRVATSELADVSRAVFNAADGRPPLGGIDVQVTQVVDRCNEQLNAALTRSTIRFRTSSAQIDAGNDELLQTLASVVANCPGNLTIAGHTDSVGDADMNRTLSQNRAAAVRDALVALGTDRTRLSARGYGETQPVGDNTTRAGRAQNRRIVITIDEL